MKSIKKIALLCALLLVGTSSWAQDGEILVSAYDEKGGSSLVFELLNEGKVAGVSFDIEFANELDAANVMMDNCVGPQKASPLAGCNMVNKSTLRVAIIHPQLGELETGELGNVFVKGLMNAQFTVRNATLVTSKGAERRIEALTNVTAPTFEKPHDSR